jgi:hypothetical protein
MKSYRNLQAGCLAGVLALCFAGSTKADNILYSNLSTPCCDFEPDNGLIILGSSSGYGPSELPVFVAASFTPVSTGYFTELDLPLHADDYNPGYNQATVELLSDSGSDSPGSNVLESWNLTAPDSPALVDLTSNGSILLSDTIQYWVAVLPNSIGTTVGWNSDAGQLASNEVEQIFQDTENAGWVNITSTTTQRPPAFDVLGTAVTSSPEPATVWLVLGAGIPALFVRLRRRSASARSELRLGPIACVASADTERGSE